MSQASTNGEFALPDKNSESGPHSELDIYDSVISPEVYDDIAQNLGLGNYSDAEYWQQMESAKQGMYAEAAFSRPLFEQTVYETIMSLGTRGWQWFDENSEEYRDPDTWEDWSEQKRDAKRDRHGGRIAAIRDRGEHLWRLLPEDEQPAVLEEYGGLTEPFRSPHWRMVEFRHEGSKSVDARLLDNLFSRVKEVKGDTTERAQSAINRLRNGGTGR
jgi:hypothetical protein